jgi:drug/metabolite transporter (DMT)-like permease
MNTLNKQTWAKLSAIFSGLVFGIYWIPLRAMEDSGFNGIWSVAMFSLVGFAIVSPYAVSRWRELIPGRLTLHLNSMLAGLAFVLYAGAFVYTEVIRVIVMFYLMPVWGFIIARIVSGEKITGIRWVSMALGLGGLAAIFGVENGVPMPSNVGDWMALSGGLMWAAVAMSILTDKQDTVNYTIGFLFWSTIIAIIAGLIWTGAGALPAPQWHQAGSVLPWLIPFAVLIIVPGAFATMYGPSQLNPGVVGLFFMIEISVGTTTAALFAGEPFGAKEIVGVILITLAGLAETLFLLHRKLRLRA